LNVGDRVSAPGKLIVLGEYSVLFGAPAVVMAVNRRAVVTCGAADGENWMVTAPGFVNGAAECVIEPSGRVVWVDAEMGARFELFERVIEEMVDRAILDPTHLAPQSLDLDTSTFFDARHPERPKLGLGSSAALTVALASVLSGRELQSCSGDVEWLRTLVALHRAVQGGLGSGIDVAASLCGGVVGFELDAGGSVAGIAPIQWPDEISRAYVWTGKSASTHSFLERLEASRAGGGKDVDAALDRLGRASERGVDALARNEPFRFFDAVDRFCEALDALGRTIEMPILSDAHRQLRRLGNECGVHYKPSGAGGGDFGVCFSTDGELLKEFSRRAEAAGFATPEVDLDLLGAVRAGM
jgi:phosphomevalonate kinase